MTSLTLDNTNWPRLGSLHKHEKLKLKKLHHKRCTFKKNGYSASKLMKTLQLILSTKTLHCTVHCCSSTELLLKRKAAIKVTVSEICLQWRPPRPPSGGRCGPKWRPSLRRKRPPSRPGCSAGWWSTRRTSRPAASASTSTWTTRSGRWTSSGTLSSRAKSAMFPGEY